MSDLDRDDATDKGWRYAMLSIPESNVGARELHFAFDPIGQARTIGPHTPHCTPLEADVVTSVSCGSWQTKHVCFPPGVRRTGRRFRDVKCCYPDGTNPGNDSQPDCNEAWGLLETWDRDDPPDYKGEYYYAPMFKSSVDEASEPDCLGRIMRHRIDPIGQERLIDDPGISPSYFELCTYVSCVGGGRYRFQIDEFCSITRMPVCPAWAEYFGPCCK